MAQKQNSRFAGTGEFIKWAIMLNLGLLITAAGVHFFKTPNHFAMGNNRSSFYLMSISKFVYCIFRVISITIAFDIAWF